ncbi:hypothetical protein [uncultured Robinsoniella sp.]|uniref:hypothetical protein n=1 Tax=uncultured Robinsoniella sp. TaxID=904190 RepID=UPI00374E559A
MSYFKDSKGIKLIPLSEGCHFFDDLIVNYAVELSKEEMDLFDSALRIMFSYCKTNNFSINGWNNLNILFTQNGSFEMLTDDESHIGGSYIKIVVYNVNSWRGIVDSTGLMAIYLEELCHHYFNISDEIEVKHRVYDIMKSFNNDFSFTEYARSIGMEDVLCNGL